MSLIQTAARTVNITEMPSGKAKRSNYTGTPIRVRGDNKPYNANTTPVVPDATPVLVQVVPLLIFAFQVQYSSADASCGTADSEDAEPCAEDPAARRGALRRARPLARSCFLRG